MSLLCSNLTLICLLAHFPGGSDGKESFCKAGDVGLIPQSERSPGEENGNPLQCSCLGNPMDRGAWRAAIHGVPESNTTWQRFAHAYLDFLKKRKKYLYIWVCIYMKSKIKYYFDDDMC